MTQLTAPHGVCARAGWGAGWGDILGMAFDGLCGPDICLERWIDRLEGRG